MTKLPTTFFIGRRQALLERAEADLIVVTANAQLQRSADTAFPFRQESNFVYLTGLNEPGLVWVCDTRSAKEWLILPQRSHYQEVFDGAVEGDELKKISGIKTVEKYERGWERVREAFKGAKTVGTVMPPPSYLEPYGIYTNPARQTLLDDLRSIGGRSKFVNLAPVLAELRMVKQPAEIKLLKEAIAVTADAFARVRRRLAKYEYEYQIQADIEQIFAAARADRGYDSIVGSGERACVLHYIANDQKLSGELVLIDAGAAVNYYSADITRTLPLKPLSKSAQKLLTAVGELQDFALAQLKPGVMLRDYEQAVREQAGLKLVELGLAKRPSKAMIGRYFPHLTSHFLGLDVHDAAIYDQPLAAGMVLTVEPGLYLPEKKMGVRIEDDVLITKTGVEVLSSAIPR